MGVTKSITNDMDLRSKILETALALFSGQGYFNTSVHHIVRSSGVSIGAIYHYFSDKEDIARTLYFDLATRMDTLIASIERDHKTAHDRCLAIIKLLFDMTETDSRSIAFMLSSRHREFLPNEPSICSSMPFQRMRRIVQEGMDGGEIRRLHVTIATNCLFGGPMRLITMRLEDVFQEPLTDHLATIWDCVWRSVAR